MILTALFFITNKIYKLKMDEQINDQEAIMDYIYFLISHEEKYYYIEVSFYWIDLSAIHAAS